MLRLQPRSGPSLPQLVVVLVVLAVLALLFGLSVSVILRARVAEGQLISVNNLRMLGTAVHDYATTHGNLPSGRDTNGFSAGAYLLHHLEYEHLYVGLDFQQPINDPKNAMVAVNQVRTFLSPLDGQRTVKPNLAATNYLFNAGSKPSLADNNGVCYQDSKVEIEDITDGTSNTLMVGETLKGDGRTKAVDLHRQHVELGEKALAGLKEDSGVQEWKDDKNIVGDRCASWIDGRFLQGTFTATRLPNEAKPDLDCGGTGGLCALRSFQDTVNVGLCDGSVRTISVKISRTTWQALATRNGGEVLGADF